MLLTSILTASVLLSPALSSQAPLSEFLGTDNGPSSKSARENAQHVFNTIHAAMRQWDSSLKHNGMSFFAATIPNNTLLYHGTHTKEPVKGMEWLAFEIEHAEMFARGRRGGPGGRRPGGGGPGRGPPGEGPPGEGGPGNGRGPPPPFAFEKNRNSASEEEPAQHGYLHTYRTSRPLTKLLYIDGMSAGKTSMGTLDSQDLVLGNASQTQAPWGDYQRAQTLCALGAEVGIEGFLRMEAGFELILCNFTKGLEFVSAYQRPDTNQDSEAGFSEVNQLEYVRGVAARYHGINGGRVVLDYSSMVSAFFYSLNLTNPDPKKAALPRLVSTSVEQRQRVKDDVVSLFSPSRIEEHSTIDWQGITDMIVTRYSDRLQFLASGNLTNRTMLSEINFLLNVFVDYTEPNIPDSIQKCTNIYLTAVPSTVSDHLIYEALSTVSRKICSTLFEVRTILFEENSPSTTKSATEQGNEAIQGLIEYLDWPAWLECGKCAYDEVCLVAIWPWGAPEDHENPRCQKVDDLRSRYGYWDMNGGGGGPRPKDGDEGREEL